MIYYYFIFFSRKSFESLYWWLEELKWHNSLDYKYILIGNNHRREDRRTISKEEAEQFKNKHELDLFFEASFKDTIKIREILIEAAKLLYNSSKPEKNKLENGNDSNEKGKKRKDKNCLII